MWRNELRVFTFAESPREEFALRFDLDEFEGFPEVGRGDIKIPELYFELAQDRVEQVVGVQRLSVADCLDGFDAGARAADVRQGHGAVQRDHRRAIELDELVVERKYLPP